MLSNPIMMTCLLWDNLTKEVLISKFQLCENSPIAHVPVPEGLSENSPAFQRREPFRVLTSPDGTAEFDEIAPTG